MLISKYINFNFYTIYNSICSKRAAKQRRFILHSETGAAAPLPLKIWSGSAAQILIIELKLNFEKPKYSSPPDELDGTSIWDTSDVFVALVNDVNSSCCFSSTAKPHVFFVLINLRLKYGCVTDAKIASLTWRSLSSETKFLNTFSKLWDTACKRSWQYLKRSHLNLQGLHCMATVER